jgi:hypothetical protein
MTKISNTNAYPYDTNITGDEYLVGTEPTGSPQNQTTSFKLSDVKNYVLGYSPYVATLTQSGTNAPVPTVMVNGVGDITTQRNSSGDYSVLSEGLFVDGKTIVFIGDTNEGANTYYSIISEDEIRINTLLDDVMNKMSIEIRVYN